MAKGRDAMTEEELRRLRSRLVRMARRRENFDAEDIAQEALEQWLSRDVPPENAEAYCARVVRRMVVKRWAKRSRWRDRLPQYAALLDDAPQGAPASLADTGRWLELEAAFTQYLERDDHEPRGRTYLVVPSLECHDIVNVIRDNFRFCREVIRRLPVSERQRERAESEFRRGIADALSRSGYRLEQAKEYAGSLENSREGSGLDLGDGDVPETIRQGFLLARRLCPSLSMDEAEAVVRSAEAVVFPEGGLGRRTPTVYDVDPGDDDEADWEMADLARELKELQKYGEGGLVIFTVDRDHEVFVQFFLAGDELIGEAASNTYLHPDRRLTKEKTRQLLDLGWQRWERLPGFYRAWPAPRTDEGRLDIVHESLHMLETVYGDDSDDPDDQLEREVEIEMIYD
jgi:hypothetical protein